MRETKDILFGDKAATALDGGLALAGQLAGITFGPRGRLVAMERTNDFPLFTKSGFVAVRDLELDASLSRIGLELAKEAATRVQYATGDGTAMAILLAAALSGAASRLKAAGHDPGRIADGFGAARHTALGSLTEQRRPAISRDLIAMLCARAGDDDLELADIVADAVLKVGPDGIVTVSFNQSVDTTALYSTGVEFERGFLSRDFADEGTTRLKLDRPLVLLCEDRLESAADVLPALEIARAEDRPLAVIAEDVVGQAMAMLVANHRGGIVRCAAVKGPGSGTYRHEMTADLAILTGGQVLSSRTGRLPSGARRDDLGGTDMIEIGSASTRILGGDGADEAVAARVRQLREAVSREDKTYDKGKLSQRLARLAAGVANIRVGAPTQSMWKERHRRAESMVSAARSAMTGGVVPGSGTSLVHAAAAVRASRPGDPVASAYAAALTEPFRHLARGSDRGPGRLQQDLLATGAGAGFDADRGRIVPDAHGMSLVDPHDVVATALAHASSLAEQVARVGCLILARGQRPSRPGTRP
jgi:chaperonin GroEL